MKVVLVYHNQDERKAEEWFRLKKIKNHLGYRIFKRPLKKEDLFVSKKLNMKLFDLIRKGDSKVKKELIGINEKDDDKI